MYYASWLKYYEMYPNWQLRSVPTTPDNKGTVGLPPFIIIAFWPQKYQPKEKLGKVEVSSNIVKKSSSPLGVTPGHYLTQVNQQWNQVKYESVKIFLT